MGRRTRWSKSEDLPVTALPVWSFGTKLDGRLDRILSIPPFHACSVEHLIRDQISTGMRHLVWLCMFISAGVQAQLDSLWLIHLPAAEIQDDRLQRFAQGHHLLDIDTTDRALQGCPTVAELITYGAGLFIRDYGPAGLSLPSLRGTGPQHTAVLWHGVPLNSPMNGVIDLSLLPSWLFNDVSVQLGGSSALWGSGAIGGAIHLGQTIRWQQPAAARLLLQQGSFGQQNVAASWQQSGKRWYSHSHFQHRGALNNYPVLHEDGTMWYRQPHAGIRQTDVAQENAFRLSKKDVVILRLWWQEADRSLPPSTGGTWNGARQFDSNLRTLATWQHQAAAYRWEWRLAAMQEAFRYDDSLPMPAARSGATTWITEGTITGTWGSDWSWQAGINGQRAVAYADGFDSDVSLAQGAGYLHLLYANHRWEAGAQLRQGAAEGYRIPPVGSLWVKRRVNHSWLLQAQISRDFRLPTLNDRFWIPGGNPLLQPERSVGQEVGAQWKQTYLKSQISWEGAAFHRNVSEWILWTPAQGIWQARNVLQVRTYGLETSLSLTHRWKKITLDASTHYQWTNAIDIDKGLQLIYTPHHQGMALVRATAGNWSIQYIHRFTGQRYISSDHSQELPAFSVAQGSIHYTITIGRHQLLAQGWVDNLWHTQYDIIPGRRMPGRSVNLSLQLLLHPIKHNPS